MSIYRRGCNKKKPRRFAEMTRFCSLKVDQTRNWIHSLIWRTPNTRSSDSISL